MGGGSAPESSGVSSTGQNPKIELDGVSINMNSSTASVVYRLQAGFAGTTMTANNVIMDLNVSAANAEASALYVGLTNPGNPTNVTVNFFEITSRSSDVTGLAFIANSVGTADETRRALRKAMRSRRARDRGALLGEAGNASRRKVMVGGVGTCASSKRKCMPDAGRIAATAIA